VEIAGTAGSEAKPAPKGAKPSFIESVLGKRKAPKALLPSGGYLDNDQDGDDENIVARVETTEQ